MVTAAAPSLASCSEIVFPTPEVPPVTIKVLPANRLGWRGGSADDGAGGSFFIGLG